MQPSLLLRLALAAGLALALAGPAGAAGAPRWQVAPAGPCAEAAKRPPCPGGECKSRTPARSRFEPTDVAATPGRGGASPPGLVSFTGPGSCADPSTPCGPNGPTHVAASPPPVPPPAAPSPADPPALDPPPPSAPPPPPAAPTPPTVIEQPVTPGTLPGLP